MSIISPAEARNAAICRHALAQPGDSIAEVTGQLIGLHNTSPVSPYLSLRARMNTFTRSDLADLMWNSWSLVRFRAMRLTMFVFPHHLLEVAAAAYRHLAEPMAARWLRDSGMSNADYQALASAVEGALADGPSTTRQLRATLGVPAAVDLPGVVGRLCDLGRVVGGAPPNSWRSSVRLYHLWDDVLPGVDLYRRDEDEAIADLIHRYLHSYGPVTINDISWWTGFTKARCRAALAGLDVEEIVVEGWPGPYYRLPTDEVPPETRGRVRALPLLDPYVQGYKDRVRFLDSERHAYIYDGGGNATATIVADGLIVGVWQIVEKPDQGIHYHLFGHAPEWLRRKAEADLTAAGELYFDRTVEVVEVPTMEPLTAAGGRSFSHPLDGKLHRAGRRNG